MYMELDFDRLEVESPTHVYSIRASIVYKGGVDLKVGPTGDKVSQPYV